MKSQKRVQTLDKAVCDSPLPITFEKGRNPSELRLKL